MKTLALIGSQLLFVAALASIVHCIALIYFLCEAIAKLNATIH